MHQGDITRSRFGMILIQQGAEAKVYKASKDGLDIIIKQRIKKSYRHPDLDEKLTKKRNTKEYKILSKLQNHGFVPNIISKTSDSITMEYISDVSLRDLLLETENFQEIAQNISKLISQLHSLNVIHGDLTTSNILFKERFFLIDFGLSFISSSIEDKAVDLYVLKKSLMSLHPEISQEFFSVFCNTYSDSTVLKRLSVVEGRGRKINDD